MVWRRVSNSHIKRLGKAVRRFLYGYTMISVRDTARGPDHNMALVVAGGRIRMKMETKARCNTPIFLNEACIFRAACYGNRYFLSLGMKKRPIIIVGVEFQRSAVANLDR